MAFVTQVTAYKKSDGTLTEVKAEAEIEEAILKVRQILDTNNIKNYNIDTIKCLVQNKNDVMAVFNNMSI